MQRSGSSSRTGPPRTAAFGRPEGDNSAGTPIVIEFNDAPGSARFYEQFYREDMVLPPIVRSQTGTRTSIPVSSTGQRSYPKHGICLAWIREFFAKNAAITKLVQRHPRVTQRQFVDSMLLPHLLAPHQCSLADHLLEADPSAVKQVADIFVSHAWDYPLKEMIDTLTSMDPDKYVFLDYFCVDQFQQKLSDHEYVDLFRSAVREIGSVHAVLDVVTSDQLVLLQRPWCILEVGTCLDPDIRSKLAVQVFPDQHAALHHNIRSNLYGLLDCFSKIDLVASERIALQPDQNGIVRDDYKMIFNYIRGEGPRQKQEERLFHVQDGLVGLMRRWVAKTAFQMSLEAFDSTSNGADDRVRNETRGLLERTAFLLHTLGEFDQAAQMWKKLVACENAWKPRDSGDDESKIPMRKSSLAIARYKQKVSIELVHAGDFAQALVYCTETCSILESLFPEDDEKFANQRIHLGSPYWQMSEIYAELGKVNEALQYRDRALQVRRECHRKMVNHMHPVLAAAKANSAKLLWKVGKTNDAEKELKDAHSYFARLYNESSNVWDAPNHSNLATIKSNLAIVYSTGHGNGQLTSANRMFESCLRQRERAFGKSHTRTAFAMNNLANSIIALRDATEMRPNIEGENSSSTVAAMYRRALDMLETAGAGKLFVELVARNLAKVEGGTAGRFARNLEYLWEKVEIRGEQREATLLTGEELLSLFIDVVLVDPAVIQVLSANRVSREEASMVAFVVYRGLYRTFGDGLVPVFATSDVKEKLLPAIRTGLCSCTMSDGLIGKLSFRISAESGRTKDSLTLIEIFCELFGIPLRVLALSSLYEEAFDSRYDVRGGEMIPIVTGGLFSYGVAMYAGTTVVAASGMAYGGGAAIMTNLAWLGGGSVATGLFFASAAGVSTGWLLLDSVYRTDNGESAWERHARMEAKTAGKATGIAGAAASAATVAVVGAGPTGLAAIGGSMLMGVGILAGGPLLAMGAVAMGVKVAAQRDVRRPKRSSEDWDPNDQITRIQPEDMAHTKFLQYVKESIERTYSESQKKIEDLEARRSKSLGL